MVGYSIDELEYVEEVINICWTILITTWPISIQPQLRARVLTGLIQLLQLLTEPGSLQIGSQAFCGCQTLITYWDTPMISMRGMYIPSRCHLTIYITAAETPPSSGRMSLRG